MKKSKRYLDIKSKIEDKEYSLNDSLKDKVKLSLPLIPESNDPSPMKLIADELSCLYPASLI